MAENREWAGPSRSARKRAAQAVEELARKLVDLPEAQLRKLPAPPEIASELRQIRAIRSLAARDRQIRHLASLLRQEEELESLEEFLAGVDRGHREEQVQFHRLEDWRDRLCDPKTFSPALEEVRQALPVLDPQMLAKLAGAVHARGDRHAFREIFRLLRRAAETA